MGECISIAQKGIGNNTRESKHQLPVDRAAHQNFKTSRPTWAPHGLTRRKSLTQCSEHGYWTWLIVHWKHSLGTQWDCGTLERPAPRQSHKSSPSAEYTHAMESLYCCSGYGSTPWTSSSLPVDTDIDSGVDRPSATSCPCWISSCMPGTSNTSTDWSTSPRFTART